MSTSCKRSSGDTATKTSAAPPHAITDAVTGENTVSKAALQPVQTVDEVSAAGQAAATLVTSQRVAPGSEAARVLCLRAAVVGTASLRAGTERDSNAPGTSTASGAVPATTAALAAAAARDATRQTLYYERWRATSAGVLETAFSTFLLLIAVKVFSASATSKAFLAGALHSGMLLTPLVVYYVSTKGFRASRAAAAVVALGAGCMLITFAFPILPVFLVCSALGVMSLGAVLPLSTQIYQDNYPAHERGKLFATTVMIRIVTTAVFAHFAARFVEPDLPGRFHWLLLAFALAMFFSSFCFSRCPSRPLARAQNASPWHTLHWLRDDAIFRRTQISWALMGVANLMMLPLRVEYMANEKYGLALPAASIALFTAIIPNIARLVFNPLWGYIFDRINFFKLRMMINAGFALGIISFFIGDSWVGLVLGAVFIGIAHAGGDLAWSLWVTRLAPPDRVAEYMSVHTFLTGVRGLAAPLLAFNLLHAFSIGSMGVACGVMIGISTLMLIPEVRAGRLAGRAEPLTEEVSE